MKLKLIYIYTLKTMADSLKIRRNATQLLDALIQDSFITRNLEKGIFNASLQIAKSRGVICTWENETFKIIYLNKLRKIYTNLDPNSYLKNIELIKKIKNKDIQPHEIAFYENKLLFPSRWENIINEKIARDQSIANIDMSSATTIYTCSKCNQNKTVYYEMQTRSADEAMSVFITCLSCGKKWKKN